MAVLSGVRRDGAPATVVLPVVVALLVPALVVRQPVLTAIGLAGLAVAVALLLRIEWALLLVVVTAPFEGYAASVSSASTKLAGLILFAGWLLRLLLDRERTRLRHPAVTAASVLLLVALAATWRHTNEGGVVVLVRYASFIGTFVVAADVLRGLLAPMVAVRAFVVACTLAAVGGMYGFLALGYDRAHGPLTDANDLAFFLVAAFPFAILLARTGKQAGLWRLCALVLLAGTATTLSRGAVVALAAMALWALASGFLRPRTALLTSGAVVVGLVVVALALPALVSQKLEVKGAVAEQNVDERRIRWGAATEMAADHPLLGVGPAGFKVNYPKYVDFEDPNPLHPLDVAHEMYLEVAAELGLPGLLAFLAVIGYGWRGARLADAEGASRETRQLAGAVRGSLVAMLVAALFLTEQYYLPIWLVCALGVALDLRRAPA
jgi:putative inorganic carbon (HCO3(-)) transporter